MRSTPASRLLYIGFIVSTDSVATCILLSLPLRASDTVYHNFMYAICVLHCRCNISLLKLKTYYRRYRERITVKVIIITIIVIIRRIIIVIIESSSSVSFVEYVEQQQKFSSECCNRHQSLECYGHGHTKYIVENGKCTLLTRQAE